MDIQTPDYIYSFRGRIKMVQKPKPEYIYSFHGEYSFLSNFYLHTFNYDNRFFSSAESAYQASKTNDPELKKQFEFRSPHHCKKLGKTVKLIDNWNILKYGIMYNILKEKFKNLALRTLLLNTESYILVESNTWHDNDWGYCTCRKCFGTPYQNNFGKLLMKIRSDIREFGDNKDYSNDEILDILDIKLTSEQNNELKNEELKF